MAKFRIVVMITLFAIGSCASPGKRFQSEEVATVIEGADHRQVRVILSDIMEAQGRSLIHADDELAVYTVRAGALVLPSCTSAPRGETYHITTLPNGVRLAATIPVCFDPARDKQAARAIEFARDRLELELAAVSKMWSARHDPTANLDVPLRMWERAQRASTGTN